MDLDLHDLSHTQNRSYSPDDYRGGNCVADGHLAGIVPLIESIIVELYQRVIRNAPKDKKYSKGSAYISFPKDEMLLDKDGHVNCEPVTLFYHDIVLVFSSNHQGTMTKAQGMDMLLATHQDDQ